MSYAHTRLRQVRPLRTVAAAFALALALPFGAAAARAQGYKAQIVGDVVDPSGASVAGATVVATNLATNVSLRTVSGPDGGYRLAQLEPGEYRVDVDAEGFKHFAHEPVTLEVDATVRVDASLEIGPVSATVVVRDETPAIDTETPSLGETITTREILDLPLNGRDYLSLAQLAPGVVPAAAGANPYNIDGARSDHVNFLIDGVSNVDRRGNEPVAAPSVDAIREFRVTTNAFSAEHGRLGASVVSVVLASGTNQFHGSLFEFHRNGALDARGFFDEEPQQLVRNQFGGTIGGPIVRDSTFFFVSYEGLRDREGQTRLARVPTLDERAGKFSSPIRNPFTGGAFPGNAIPADLIDPVAARILSFIPEPNRAGALNFVTSGRLATDSDDVVVRVDHRLGEADRLSGRLLIDDARDRFPFRSTPLPGFGSVRSSRRYHVSGSFTHVFGPRTINDLRAGFVRGSFSERSVNAGASTSADVGLTGVAPGLGLADVVVVGYAEVGDAIFLPDEWTDNEYVVSDTLNLKRGSHDVRVGGEFQRSQHFNLFAAYAGGQVGFLGAFTFNPFADFLLGLPFQTIRQVGSNKSYLFGNYLGLFAQDDWRVHQNLTLSFGLRYDVSPPAVEKYDRLSNFMPDSGEAVVASSAGYPRSLLRTDRNNFSPRVGFAWRPFGTDRTAVRGGYGIFHAFDLQFTKYQFLAANAFPFTRLEVFRPVAVGDPSLADPFPTTRPGATPAALTPSGWDFENPTSYSQRWSLTVAQEIAEGFGVEVSYVGNKGTHLSATVNLNQTIRTPEGAVVPFPGYGRIIYQTLGADSIYHALQVSVEKRFRAGLGFRSSYTLSKSIDEASFGSRSRLPQATSGLGAERGLSEFDRRHVWTAAAVWQLPVGRSRRFGASFSPALDAVLGGWQVNTVAVVASGRPFTPVVSLANADAGFATRPDRLRSGEVASPTVERWFDPTAFRAVPADAFRFGNSGRDILTGPGLVSIDASVFKEFTMPWEDHRLQIRAEFFNLPNHANFGQPDARIDQPTAGIVSTADPGRQIQLAVKYLF